MKGSTRLAGKAAGVAFVLLALSPHGASAVELIKKLDCTLTQTTHAGADDCLTIFNTCNTPVVSRIEGSGGVQTDSLEVRSGERGKICSKTPFAFLGHYITGPLAQGAGD